MSHDGYEFDFENYHKNICANKIIILNDLNTYFFSYLSLTCFKSVILEYGPLAEGSCVRQRGQQMLTTLIVVAIIQCLHISKKSSYFGVYVIFAIKYFKQKFKPSDY